MDKLVAYDMQIPYQLIAEYEQCSCIYFVHSTRRVDSQGALPTSDMGHFPGPHLFK